MTVKSQTGILLQKMEIWQSLPEDFRVTTFICLGGAGFLLGLYLLGRLLTFRRPDSVLPHLLVAGGVLAVVGSISLYLDRQPTIPGVVESKREEIDVDSDGNWSHVLKVQVTYTPPGASEPRSGDLSADDAIYDRVSAGDRVDVRYLHLGGWFAFARLSDRSTLSIILDGRSWLFSLPLIAGVVLLIWVMAAASKQSKLSILLAIGALTLFVFLIN